MTVPPKKRDKRRDHPHHAKHIRIQARKHSTPPAVLHILQAPPDPYRIHWICDTTGHAGIADYLRSSHGGATVFTPAKKADLAYIFVQNPTKTVVFDLSPRTTQPNHYLDGIYSLAVDLKDGRVMSTKYQPKTIFFAVPRVIFLANFQPDMTKWSQARYHVINI